MAYPTITKVVITERETEIASVVIQSVSGVGFKNGDNARIKNGQLQVWDPVAYAANSTKPWRPVSCSGGMLATGEPVAD